MEKRWCNTKENVGDLSNSESHVGVCKGAYQPLTTIHKPGKSHAQYTLLMHSALCIQAVSPLSTMAVSHFQLTLSPSP